jgi:hypothetical protein
MAAAAGSSLEARLSALEAQLGVSSSSEGPSRNDMSIRLDALQSTIETQTTSQFRETWHESQKLFRELDPGMALTHQQQPLLYRRQEVLAASGSLQTDMGELGNILHLLLTSQREPANQQQPNATLREDQVTQAPILTSVSVSPEDQRRLDALRLTLEGLNVRTQKLTTNMDQMLECYHAVMTAASEKCILADETISYRERAAK